LAASGGVNAKRAAEAAQPVWSRPSSWPWRWLANRCQIYVRQRRFLVVAAAWRGAGRAWDRVRIVLRRRGI